MWANRRLSALFTHCACVCTRIRLCERAYRTFAAGSNRFKFVCVIFRGSVLITSSERAEERSENKRENENKRIQIREYKQKQDNDKHREY